MSNDVIVRCDMTKGRYEKSRARTIIRRDLNDSRRSSLIQFRVVVRYSLSEDCGRQNANRKQAGSGFHDFLLSVIEQEGCQIPVTLISVLYQGRREIGRFWLRREARRNPSPRHRRM